MNFKHILITGGAGFVGANLAIEFKRAFADVHVVAVDNLRRRGSELNLARLRRYGVEFLHGDVRAAEDVAIWPDFDLLIDCAAEPSVQAGASGSPAGVLANNLAGTINCLEAARRASAAFVLLSTSRVYPIAAVNHLPFREGETRFEWEPADAIPGFSQHGIAESFPLDGARSFYGASKLACELLLEEYAYNTGMPALIDRCGVLCGPWQMGKVDQGVVTLWVARHVFEQPLSYIGFGGHGKQVRDVLHVADLFDLLVRQLNAPAAWQGRVFNVGGGRDISLSLCELTDHCRRATGRTIEIGSRPETSHVDVRIYLSDTRRAQAEFAWRPQRSVEQIIAETHDWLTAHRDQLAPILG
jgi:CDP-paratose 2-epimerase